MKNLILVLFAFFYFTSFLFSQTIQWEPLSGPHGGSIYSIVKDDNSGNIYANTMWGAGPFKSTDNGETWFSIKNGLTPYDGQFHPLNINSNGDLFIGGAHSTNILCRSTDQGNSWIPLPNSNTGGTSIICISFDQANNIYVGTGTGVYRSTDNGENWTWIFQVRQVDAIAFNDSGHIFLGTDWRVYRSTDNGTTWIELPMGGGGLGLGTRTVAVAPNGYVFVGLEGENSGILRSTNNGDSWTYSYPQTVKIKPSSTPFFDDYNYIYFPTNGMGILFSSDYGDSWTEFNDGLGNKNVRAVTKTLNQFLFAGGDYGIFKCDTWAAYPFWYSTGLPVCGVKRIAVNDYNNIFTCAWGVNRSFDGGQSWETINNGLSILDVRAIAIKNDGTIFLGCGMYNYAYPNPCIFRSTDNGNSWVVLENGIERHDVEAIGIDNDGNIYAGNVYGVYKSTNNGDSWVNIGGVRDARAIEFNSQGDLFLASYYTYGGIWKLPAGDSVWVNLLPGAKYSFFIGSNEYLYTDNMRSTDNGNTWLNMSGIQHAISSFTENSIGHLYCGTFAFGSGVYRSTDYGDTWHQINSGLPTWDIRSVAVDKVDYLYAGTWGYSLYKTTTSTVISVEEENELPTTFYLEQNYPNPFNPSTVISYQIPASLNTSKGRTLVTLKVYDVLGNEIATLVDEYREAGRNEVTFDASKLASGMYLYRLQAGSFIQTKKMILLR
jgi:photosystem II stability/assembly factor-like uncharacterized protein